MTIRIKLPEPHPAQDQVLEEAKRFNVLCCGRRWGKTTIALDRIIRGVLAGRKVAWFSPTFSSLGDAWRSLATTLQPVTRHKNGSEHRLETIGAGSLECWSLDNPDAGRGRAYHLIVIDEAAKVRDLATAWEQSIRPMLADYEGGAWFLSTPRGTADHFCKLWRDGQDPQKPDWASWQMPTSLNPYIKASEIAAAKADLTDLAFSQEYLAQFVTWAGSVFRRIQDAILPAGHSPRTCAMIGVDWGRSNDYTVFTALSQIGEVIAIDRFRGMEYSLQRARLHEFWQQQGGRCWILAEVNSMGGPVVEQLQRDCLPVVPFVTTGPSKAQIIEALALAFERGVIKIPNDPVLIGELQAFECKGQGTSFARYAAPEGQHDDTVMSLAFAWWGLVAPREQTQHIDPNTGRVVAQPVPYQISPI